MNHKQEILEFKTKFDQIIADKKSIMVVAHKNPDDDSVASMLGVYRYLRQAYPEKSVEVFTFSLAEDRWHSFDDFGVIKFLTDESYDFSRFDLLIGVDASQFTRFHPNTEFFTTFKGQSVCIDHHKNEVDKFDLSLVLGDFSSNAEIVFNVFYDDGKYLDKTTAEILILGILGDTGNFRFVNYKQSEVFLVVKRLIEVAEMNIQEFMSRYGTYSEKTFLAVQYVVAHAKIMEIEGWPRFMLSYLDRKCIDDMGLKESEVSAAIHIFVSQYGTSLAEVSWGMVFSARDEGIVSASMRSRPGSVNVRKIGQETGKGGGHDRAGGLKFYEEGHDYDTQECIEWLMDWMKTNMPVLE
jgi:phosphoesterase RecJ-like protein